MEFTCIYKSGTKFGTGQTTTNYVASVTSLDESVVVAFDFRNPPQGKSHPGVSDAAVKSLTINLSANEALQLAASIIAQAHHPSIHDSCARWIPPEFMPVLTKNRWSRKLKVNHRHWNNEVRFVNESKFHIGRVELQVGYRIYKEGEGYSNHTAKVWKLIDLPPGGSRTVDIMEDDIPWRHRDDFSRMLAAEAVAATGIVPGEAL